MTSSTLPGTCVGIVLSAALITLLYVSLMIVSGWNHQYLFKSGFLKPPNMMDDEIPPLTPQESKFATGSSSYQQEFNLGELKTSSEHVKVYVYDIKEFDQYSVNLFDKEGVKLPSTDETLSYNSLTTFNRNNRSENLMNLALGYDIELNGMKTFGKSRFGNVFYWTSDLALEPWLHYRFMLHPNRVYSIEQADVAFVPFYSFLLKLKTNDHIKALTAYVQFVLPKIRDRKIPHIVPYAGIGYNRKEMLRDLYKFSPKNFYFLCYEEDQRGYADSKGPSRVLTVPYLNLIHSLSESKQKKILPFRLMKMRENLVCGGEDYSNWPSNILNSQNSPQSHDFKNVAIEEEELKKLGPTGRYIQIIQLLSKYSSCRFSLHSGEHTSRLFYFSLAVGTVPVLLKENEKAYSSIFRGAVEIEKMSIILPESLKSLNNAPTQKNVILDYLRSIPLNLIEEKRKYMYDHAHYLQYSIENDKQDAVALSIGSVLLIQKSINEQDVL